MVSCFMRLPGVLVLNANREQLERHLLADLAQVAPRGDSHVLVNRPYESGDLVV